MQKIYPWETVVYKTRKISYQGIWGNYFPESERRVLSTKWFVTIN